jgi:ABC transport system ATP-binding/permease protein
MALLISAQSVSKSDGVAPLFTDISFSIYEGDRLGLIGPNGCGKSTLLKILMGLETPDSGKVVQNRGQKLIYLAQEDRFNVNDSIQTVLFGSVNHLNKAECQRLIWEVTGEAIFSDLEKAVGTLSGGWRKRLGIVQALLQKPDLLLMDEPTNHLDLEGILWLEEVLNNAMFAFVLVSHDRYFLENTVNSIMELNRAYLDGFLKCEGNYSDFVHQRNDVLAGQMQREQSLANKMKREQEWLQRGPKARTTKAQSRIDNAEKLREELRQIKASNAQQRTAGIDFDATGRRTKILVEAHQLKMTRGGRLLFANLDLKLSPGFCLGLLGQNGSGKSTLLNLIKGDLSPDAGSIDRAANLRIVTFGQKREQLNQNQTLWKALAPDSDSVVYKGQPIHVAAWAKRFLFPADQLHQSVSRLSGGEQARVLIANLMREPADILLLDEPTNDLDIPTLEILEESLSEFPGAIVLITHDRFLLDRLSDQILYLDGQGKTEFFADYAQWRQSQQKKPKTVEPVKSAPITRKKLTYDEQKELSRLPAKIQKAEEELSELQNQLSASAIMNDQKRLTQLCEQIEAAKTKIENLYTRWQKLDTL